MISPSILYLLLSVGVLSALKIQPAATIGTVYIRADGSIDPPDAPISTFDEVTYTLTGNITSGAGGIVVERSNISVDGNGYALQGTGSGNGFYCNGTNEINIRHTNIRGFDCGFHFESSSDNIIYGNNVTSNNFGVYLNSSSANAISANNIANNLYGVYFHRSFTNMISFNDITDNGNGIYVGSSSDSIILGNRIIGNNLGIHLYGSWLYGSFGNIVFGNNITANRYYGVHLDSSENNKFAHNNFIDNGQQAYSDAGYGNMWDDGYPSGGNYWSDYSGVDLYRGLYQNETGNDGIVDTPYVINRLNKDDYPLVAPYHSFANEGDVNRDGKVDVKDIAMVSAAFGSYPGRQNWNPACDINFDCRIDIIDLARTSANFGWHI